MKAVKRAYLGLILFFLYCPIIALIVFSFNSYKSITVWGGFSLQWYYKLFNDANIMTALRNTLLIAVFSSVIATVIGTVAALGINDMGKVSKKVVLNITNLPVMNPDIVTGISLAILYLAFFSFVKVGKLGFGTLLMSHITFNIPYVILSVLPKLRQLDKNLYEAALDLGATPGYAFFKVILPEITPGIITGMLLAFTLSIDDFVISFFTTGAGADNLSTLIYSMTRRGINPEINALSTIMFFVVLILLYLVNMRSGKKNDNEGDEYISEDAMD